MSCQEAAVKICSLCGENMTCGIQSGNSTCWCFDLPHVMKMETASAGCLCRDCLEAAIKKQSGDFYSQSKQLSQYR